MIAIVLNCYSSSFDSCCMHLDSGLVQHLVVSLRVHRPWRTLWVNTKDTRQPHIGVMSYVKPNTQQLVAWQVLAAASKPILILHAKYVLFS